MVFQPKSASSTQKNAERVSVTVEGLLGTPKVEKLSLQPISIWVITIVTLLITPLITPHEPPYKVVDSESFNFCFLGFWASEYQGTYNPTYNYP